MSSSNGKGRIEIVNEQGQVQGGVITEFSVTGNPTWEWLGAGTFSFMADPSHEAVQHIRCQTRGCEVRYTTPENDVWWGFPLSAGGSISNDEFQCQGLLDKLGKRFIDRASVIYDGVEQMDIVSALIQYAQSEATHPYRYENIWPRKLFQDLSAKLRYREYSRDSSLRILDLIVEFATITPSIGYRMNWEKLTANSWIRYLDIFPILSDPYPLAFPLVYKQGRAAGNNIVNFAYTEDASDLANVVWCKGGSSGDVRFEGVALSGTSIQIHGEQTAIISESDMKDPTWLTDRAHREAESRAEPQVSVTLQSAIVPDLVGKFMEDGQVWPIKIDRGRIKADYNARVLKKEYKGNGLYEISFSGRVEAVAA